MASPVSRARWFPSGFFFRVYWYISFVGGLCSAVSPPRFFHPLSALSARLAIFPNHPSLNISEGSFSYPRVSNKKRPLSSSRSAHLGFALHLFYLTTSANEPNLITQQNYKFSSTNPNKTTTNFNYSSFPHNYHLHQTNHRPHYTPYIQNSAPPSTESNHHPPSFSPNRTPKETQGSIKENTVLLSNPSFSARSARFQPSKGEKVIISHTLPIILRQKSLGERKKSRTLKDMKQYCESSTFTF